MTLMRKKITTTLTHPSQLRPLSAWRFKRRPGLGKICLPESLAHERRDFWQQEINRYYYACGCDTGAKGVVLCVLAAAAWCLWRWSQGSLDWSTALKALGLASVGGALLGKTVGLAIAARRLELVKREVLAAWKLPPRDGPPLRPEPLCG